MAVLEFWGHGVDGWGFRFRVWGWRVWGWGLGFVWLLGELLGYSVFRFWEVGLRLLRFGVSEFIGYGVWCWSFGFLGELRDKISQ